MVKTVKTSLFVAISCLVFSIALVLMGCSISSSSSTNNQSKESSTKTVVDAYNRSVEVPRDAKTAATVGSGARFVVYAGAQDKLIAVTEMEKDPALNRPYAFVYKDKFADLPSTSNGNHLLETNVNEEQLIELTPDVIISSRSAEECDALQKNTGIPVIGISYQNQLFTDNVYKSIECVAEALGTEEHAKQVIDKLKSWDNDLKSRTSDIAEGDKPSVYVGAVNYKGAKSFTGTYANYAPLVELNAKNIADETGQSAAVDVDLEQIGNWDPDYMFLNAGNMDLMKDDYGKNKDFFDSLKAFKNGNLFTQPFFNFNGTNIDTGICDTYFIGATIYPDKFADVDLSAKYSEIYTTLLGSDFYEVMKSKGMDFKSISFS